MSLQPGDGLVAHKFAIQIDGVQVQTLQEVGWPTMEQDVITVNQITEQGKPMVKNLPGAGKGGTITVVRGVDGNNAFSKWIEASFNGNMGEARKNATVEILDYQGSSPKVSHHLENAWVSKMEGSTLKAGEASMVTQTVTISFETIRTEYH